MGLCQSTEQLAAEHSLSRGPDSLAGAAGNARASSSTKHQRVPSVPLIASGRHDAPGKTQLPRLMSDDSAGPSALDAQPSASTSIAAPSYRAGTPSAVARPATPPTGPSSAIVDGSSDAPSSSSAHPPPSPPPPPDLVSGAARSNSLTPVSGPAQPQARESLLGTLSSPHPTPEPAVALDHGPGTSAQPSLPPTPDLSSRPWSAPAGGGAVTGVSSPSSQQQLQAGDASSSQPGKAAAAAADAADNSRPQPGEGGGDCMMTIHTVRHVSDTAVHLQGRKSPPPTTAVALCLAQELHDEDRNCCPTCLDEYTPENPRVWTECVHHFHMPCILEWMQRKDTCPICGSKMRF